MNHRAYQIADRIRELLLNKTLAHSRVEVGRMHTINVNELPFVSVEIGEDAPLTPLGTDNTVSIDSQLTIMLDIYELWGRPDEILLEIRRDTHIALMADDTIGLEFVLNVIYGGADGVLKDPERRMAKAAMLRTFWHVLYRMNYEDPSSEG